MQENRELLIAALLFDIERFYGKSAAIFIEDYRELFDKYLDSGKLCGIVSGSYVFHDAVSLIWEARELSLMESVRTDKKKIQKNLTSVFSRIQMQKEEVVQRYDYEFHELSPQGCFPVRENTTKRDIADLRNSFKMEMEALSKENPDSFDAFLTILDGILERYLWCITASDYEGEDISLYAHMKNTAVITMCKWFSREKGAADKKEFCMVMADFSGIQKYIFSVNNINESGVAKRLRARSFMVDIMVTVLSHVLLHKFQVNFMHTLLLTGGKFYLLLPNTGDTENHLKEARSEFNRYVYRRFKGQIAVNLVWLLGGNELLLDYSKTMMTLSEKLAVEKTVSFQDILQDDQGWREEMFELYQDLNGKKVCPSCESELTDKKNECCENCRIQEEIGGMLPRAKYLVYSDQGGKYPIYGNYGLTICHEIPENGGYLIEKLNDPSIQHGERKLPVKCRFMANHIPADRHGRPKSFSEIAQSASGDPKLGVLKADVDTLGFIFSSGLRDVEDSDRHYGTISRTATMSKLLVMFFSGYIDHLLDEKKKYKDIYCVFSGGDDLFLVGPWDVLFDFAVYINKEFHRFTGYNRNLTLSAALELFQPKTHISFMAERSEESLKRVKDDSTVIYPEKSGRNGVGCLDMVFSWEDFEYEWERAKNIAEWWLASPGNRNSFPVNRMNSILEYSKMYQRFLLDHDIMGLMCSPYLEYDINRNYQRGKIGNDQLWKYVTSLNKNVADYRKPKRELYFAQFCMYALKKLTKEVRLDGI